MSVHVPLRGGVCGAVCECLSVSCSQQQLLHECEKTNHRLSLIPAQDDGQEASASKTSQLPNGEGVTQSCAGQIPDQSAEARGEGEGGGASLSSAV